MLFGCIGDDFTGSSDLGNTLAKEGMRVVQYTGVPDAPADAEVEAGVIALKTRSVPVAEAVNASLAALDWLLAQGAQQIFFKYCSTFDSTREGNIGPVAEALAARLGAGPVVFCPAFPGTGRSVYQGHLFVQDRLLSESGMQDHPLTPMTDPDLRRWLAHQTRGPVGHVPAETVFQGASAIRAALDAQAKAGRRNIIVDAIRDTDLRAIGAACRDLPLITGGSGVALGLPAGFDKTPGTVPWEGQAGPVICLSGSCSLATRAQVAYHARTHPVREIAVEEVMEGRVQAGDLADWALAQSAVPVIYSSTDPGHVAAVQARWGQQATATALETLFAQIAQSAVAKGATRVITAGGETSGAIVEALAPAQLEIGPEIAPGVPALRASPNLTLALKSGNFGAQDFFVKAAARLEGS